MISFSKYVGFFCAINRHIKIFFYFLYGTNFVCTSKTLKIEYHIPHKLFLPTAIQKQIHKI